MIFQVPDSGETTFYGSYFNAELLKGTLFFKNFFERGATKWKPTKLRAEVALDKGEPLSESFELFYI